LEVIVRRTVVDTGAATVDGVSEPSGFAVNAAGRTALAPPLDGATRGVVLVEGAAAVGVVGVPAVAVCCAVVELELDPHPATGRTKARTPRTKTALRRLIDPLSAADKWSNEV
jgi:hypothetical protein